MSVKKKLAIFFKPYSAILFLNDPKAGMLLALLSFLLPSVGALGLVALVATILFAEFVNMREEYLRYGFYLYNSLLVGFGIGFFYQISILSIILTILLAIFTFLLSFSLNRIFIKYGIPILSLPFSLVSILFFLASLKYTTLLTNLLDRQPLFDIALPFEYFFKTVGEIFFLPYNIVGFVVSLLILWFSRILFFLMFAGFGVGVAVHSLFVQTSEALWSLYNFNFLLIAMALGGIFLIPHIKNYVLALIAVALSVFISDAMQVFFNLFNIPVYTIPFNIIVILFVFLLYTMGYRLFAYIIKRTPEETLEYYLANTLRFGANSRKISLPFLGEWSVYQAFDGEWTHRGDWKYAYDFIKIQDGKSYAGSGVSLQEYYAYGQDVVAPVNGYIVDIRDDLPDNPIGVVDRIHNWGNFIIIKSDEGFFVEISHLMQHSIKVRIGEYVKSGQMIAKCGNSGYSPEPHIHIQVQEYQFLGARTLPFVFDQYIQKSKLIFHGLPREKELIENVSKDRALFDKLSFVLDEKYTYEVMGEGDKKESYSFTVKMNDLGEFYFYDGENRAYFAMNEKMFYFYDYKGKESYLKHLYLIAPRIPFIAKRVEFIDFIPLSLYAKGFKKICLEFVVSFCHRLGRFAQVYYKDRLEQKSDYGMVKFSFYNKGFEEISYGQTVLRRKIDENSSI
ncbi:urea transporter [Nitratiruptor sp. YY09-18]|uniref:urea transporter n=1 Tax=Nitratiruptor sp. YY09-18 TaxID=2724901 RepID=UPI00191678B0|nr:urea transporter [Nitratiruptor sp. YY09-18]BCD67473.1 peptidase, M23/M37 family [Nitratiruptor sp. YY09-18]